MTAGDKLTEYAASWIADCGESYDTADAHAAQLVEEFRAELAEEFAAAVLADTAHIRYGSATDYAERHAALIRSMADAATPISGHSCGNCEGIDPDSCLANPERATTPISKEQQR